MNWNKHWTILLIVGALVVVRASSDEQNDDDYDDFDVLGEHTSVEIFKELIDSLDTSAKAILYVETDTENDIKDFLSWPQTFVIYTTIHANYGYIKFLAHKTQLDDIADLIGKDGIDIVNVNTMEKVDIFARKLSNESAISRKLLTEAFNEALLVLNATVSLNDDPLYRLYNEWSSMNWSSSSVLDILANRKLSILKSLQDVPQKLCQYKASVRLSDSRDDIIGVLDTIHRTAKKATIGCQGLNCPALVNQAKTIVEGCNCVPGSFPGWFPGSISSQLTTN